MSGLSSFIAVVGSRMRVDDEILVRSSNRWARTDLTDRLERLCCDEAFGTVFIVHFLDFQ